MLVSLKWLRDYVDIDLSPRDIAAKLTMIGLEVESIESIRPGFSDVRVARISRIEPHPNADKLLLCEVSTPEGDYPVVCGAHNIKAGDIVPFAMVGARLPGGKVIKKSKIRGEISEGMLCSEEELLGGSDASGIMLLPEDLPMGSDLAEVLGFNDTVFDISVTPNRADCLSIIGIAREIAAATGKRIHYPDTVLRENNEDIHQRTSVTIEDPDLCPRYTARLIRDVRIGTSPPWLRKRIEAVGLRSINNIVDVTNFVMMEMGHPLHAFDFDHLAEGKIVVRRSHPEEKFVSLDGKERILPADALLICDGQKPVAIGGVMGGLNSEVTDNTKTILLESAYFKPSSIRRTARAMAMGTDASFRFERGIDPEGVVRALDRAAKLIAELSAGNVCKGVIDQNPGNVVVARDIVLRLKNVEAIIGAAISEDEVMRIIGGLEMEIRKANEEVFLVTPLSSRVDITREIDLIEEIARLYGYDRIPATLPLVSPISQGSGERKRTAESAIRHIMNGFGYTEAINYSFIHPSAADDLLLFPDDSRRKQILIKNPLSDEQSVMRTTIVYGLLRNVLKNFASGRADMKLFEIGRTYRWTNESEEPSECTKAGFLITGRRYQELWNLPAENADFYDLKGCVENVFHALMVLNPSYRSVSSEPFLHPGKSCGLFSGDDRIGFLGEVHPEVLLRLGLSNSVTVCELDLDATVAHSATAKTFINIPKFPAILRDAAFLIRREVEAEAFVLATEKSREELLEKVEVFDVYEGNHIPDGMKSLGLRFQYRSGERTLTDEEVNVVHGRVMERIIRALGASIR
jgi:phenylalanyl-tRNA synthetase beta chain